MHKHAKVIMVPQSIKVTKELEHINVHMIKKYHSLKDCSAQKWSLKEWWISLKMNKEIKVPSIPDSAKVVEIGFRQSPSKGDWRLDLIEVDGTSLYLADR